jgi:hypothetical protein
MADIYDEDILLWSEQQAELLRRMAQGDRVNDQVDWENVAEEIVDVGRSELRAVASYLVRPYCTISKPRHGRYRGRCLTGGQRREGTATMRARPSRGRWRSERSWRFPSCIAAPCAGCPR